MERRVHAPGAGVDHRRQCVDVRPEQLGILAILEHLGRQLVPVGQGFQHVGIRARARLARPPTGRQLQLAKEHFLELLGRSDVEFAPGEPMDFRLQAAHAERELAA